ncbi:MAG: LAGLIDADG family homing endonuclease [Patescibacteria group bacterium]
MRITGRPKTSIYQHIRNLPLSEKRIQSYKNASGEHIRKFALARKGMSEKVFSRFETWTPELVLLVAHLSFDGGLRHGIVEYNNRSETLIRRVELLMQKLYEHEPKRILNPKTGVIRTSYYNVPFSSYLKNKSNELLRKIGDCDLKLKREFLRAFFDDEGCMDFKPSNNKKRVRGYQKNVEVLYLVQTLLKDMGIDSRITFPNEVVISGKENLVIFQKEINFSLGVCINGNRSNSVWKEHLEKRELLEMAINSYKT